MTLMTHDMDQGTELAYNQVEMRHVCFGPNLISTIDSWLWSFQTLSCTILSSSSPLPNLIAGRIA